MVTILRIGHRINRDKRITTHLALVARAFGAGRLIIAGDEDKNLLNTMNKVISEWGGNFLLEMIPYDEWKTIITEWQKEKKTIVHLTMYGENLVNFEKTKNFSELQKQREKLAIIVGGEKIPGKVFKFADWNISISNQPHSEVSSLAVFLDHFLPNALEVTFDNPEKQVFPSLKGFKRYK